ncbi:hypothetical protein TNCV_3979781 [Trichonephila clavipes]|nr:hypothetical protein TNCV_3979781 [Trichonephila clavipes]
MVFTPPALDGVEPATLGAEDQRQADHATQISYFACKFFERVRVKLTSHCKTTRGLLAMDLAILNLGQVTRMTPELSPPSPNYHTTPTGGASTYLRCIAPLHTGSWVVPGHD